MTVHRRSCPRSLAAMAVALAAPGIASAQLASARPASVALTVVVPPHAAPTSLIRERTIVVQSTPTAMDLQTTVRLADRTPSRVEVRLAAGYDTDALRVWVRGANGVFERLDRQAHIIAATATPARSVREPPPLQFHVESDRPIAGAGIAIPMEYRVTVGTGEQVAIWSFPSVIRLDAPGEPTGIR